MEQKPCRTRQMAVCFVTADIEKRENIMRIKNKDIAKQLGISTTAVSLAINNRPGVSEDTRLKVMQLISDYADLGVREIMEPRSLETGTILLCIHKKHGEIINDKPFFSDLIETIQQEAMRNSYTLTVAHFVPGQNPGVYADYLRNIPASGVIVLGTEMEEGDCAFYMKLGKPVVLLDASFPLFDMDSVTIDNRSSVLRALDYAVKNGHRDIGYLRSSRWISNFQDRYDGFLKGIADYGLEAYNHPVIELPCTMEGAHEEMAEFLKRMPSDFRMPSIFLSDLDYIAVGAMGALKEAGYRVPEDVSLIGYDDLPICLICEPNLTSIRVNQYALGRLVVSRLTEKIGRAEDYSAVIEVASELMVRESVSSR